ncbi:serine palmitoyltransferase component [Clydaea vesicula]|uniref:serine C-palmitoyltransferase n=1 Tax=Clydaea vesicula TaxID=447962 RepID=A0AAD5XX32_9FUNG|nr:serine palmitoyltransferase component [Clydaea vesicula]KAJ3387264.1 serine palmitoyltransferase component [Lobulomyces angularis]
MGRGQGKGKKAFLQQVPPISTLDTITKPPTIISPQQMHRTNSNSTLHTEKTEIEEAPIFTLVTTYISYFILILFGHIRDVFGQIFKKEHYEHLHTKNGMAPINHGFDTFYHRRLYVRIRDVFNRPITNVPGRTVTLLDRTSSDFNKTFEFTGKTREVLNLSSYNYLGFAQAQGPCADAVEAAVKEYGIASASPRMDVGTHALHVEAEKLIANFLGKEDCLLVSMGFATNSTTLPALVSKGCLIISDELNHSSLVYGARLSGANIRIFKHNDMEDLEAVVRESISQGQPRTHRPWKKILLVVEGLYSMEGTICNLPKIVEIKKKYKLFVYLDEAHSIGALGPNGRGVCDYFGIDPKEIDIMMGTFTKSFGAAGGYLGATREVIEHLRFNCQANIYAEAMAIPVLQQVITSLNIISGKIEGGEGRRRIQQLATNASYFAKELRKMGFIVYGKDSPVVPLLLFHPAKIPAFSREMLKRGIAVVVVGYPATPIITSRVRFCLSAAHTMEDMNFALEMCSEVGDLLQLKVTSEGKKHLKEE